MDSRVLSQPNTREWRTAERTQEQILVERAQHGDSEAFGQLYERLVTPIYRYIYFRVADDATAEDLTAEVFVKVWEHLPRYEARNSTILTWIHRIAHNTVIDHYRMHKPTQPLDDVRSLSSREPQPAEQSELRIESETVRHALQYLTADQRAVLIMRFLDGMETDEIAAHMKRSPGAVRALQMRGLHMLSRTLGE